MLYIYLFVYLIYLFTSFNACTSALPTPSVKDIDIITERRIDNIITQYKPTEEAVNKWASTLNNITGTWSNINYISGCAARRANWPATNHLLRTLQLAIGYHDDTSNKELLSKTLLALNYWLDNDFTEDDCVDKGGKKGSKCPCGTPGLWNSNWYDQVILIPRLIGSISLIIKDELSPEQLSICNRIMSRAFKRATRTKSSLTGANLLDVSSIGISLGLLNRDTNTLLKALELFYSGAKISPVVAGDGIQSDGSFMQHNGLLYNGNYGKDYINDLLSVFIETKGTDVLPSIDVQNAFETLIEGTEWMIMADTDLHSLLWQYSVIGRMISFKYSDKQASGGVAIDIPTISEGTEGWASEETFHEIEDRLTQPASSANQGKLTGSRYFYNADYFVHRMPDYIVTMKMYSTRTVNSECVNSQNPFGFHLSDGAIYNYLSGDEYKDIFAVWNWELIPGITVDMGVTPLNCKKSKTVGKRDFVGGATDGDTGIVVFDYLNPFNGHLSFKKTAFFFPNAYAIQLGSVDSTNTTAPLVTVLDQRRRDGDIFVNGKLRNTNTSYTALHTNSLWHNDIGYYFPESESIQVDSKVKNGSWSSIGISKGKEEERVWTAYVKHVNNTNSGLLTQYIVQPSIDHDVFNRGIKANKIPIALDYRHASPQVNAAYSEEDKVIAIAFWTSGEYKMPWKSIIVDTDSPCVIILREIKSRMYRLTVADPSQKLSTINLSVRLGVFGKKQLKIDLLNGVLAGKAINYTLKF
ncbi:hypothetical protein RMCBS344292_15227 [Rhizopus microsporus]|nr:hypothetical protein RMCBS344292_15227 [Rhizopus microsporus]